MRAVVLLAKTGCRNGSRLAGAADPDAAAAGLLFRQLDTAGGRPRSVTGRSAANDGIPIERPVGFGRLARQQAEAAQYRDGFPCRFHDFRVDARHDRQEGIERGWRVGLGGHRKHSGSTQVIGCANKASSHTQSWLFDCREVFVVNSQLPHRQLHDHSSMSGFSFVAIHFKHCNGIQFDSAIN